MSMMTSPDFIPSSIEPAWSVDVDSDSQIYDKPEFNSVYILCNVIYIYYII